MGEQQQPDGCGFPCCRTWVLENQVALHELNPGALPKGYELMATLLFCPA
uniref:Uncharacterized protein n=1 Tax=Aegilops tauschii TaxID=37682 RepID=M8BS79_AEGTA